MTQLEKSCLYLHWAYAFDAVLFVYSENLKNEGPLGPKASADVWATNDELRQSIWRRARRHWCDQTGRDITWFPLSVDAVARLYFRVRKRSAAEIEAFKREVASTIQTITKDQSSAGLFD